ncbi:hypothetical protein GPA19_22820 [Azoarcus indigens]|uniref:hypothetical protein n=1 Tax=Azoarcus indigens TaxID=29545 RepID=UPI0010605A49|nr:hypothetical protein [Azoarcus indigens]NMG67781.1 hypothetical protein [Azoarcus indigens]
MRTLRFGAKTQTAGKFIRQLSSRDVYAHVEMVVEPTECSELEVLWQASENAIPKTMEEHVRRGIFVVLEKENAKCLGTVVRIIGGSFNSIDSSPKCYEVASAQAFSDAIATAGIWGSEA